MDMIITNIMMIVLAMMIVNVPKEVKPPHLSLAAPHSYRPLQFRLAKSLQSTTSSD